MLSIHSRLVIAATFVLVAFLGLTGWTLDKAYWDSAQTALRERLEAYMYALIAASELQDDGHLRIPTDLPDARFSTPGSGLYAEVRAHDSSSAWRSKSSLGVAIGYPSGLSRGESGFAKMMTAAGQEVYTFNFGLAWEVGGKERAFTFSVAESLTAFDDQVAAFRQSLWGSLLVGSILLLAVQGTILRWGLSPLRRLVDGLSAVEEGKAKSIAGIFPKELDGLTARLNAFIANERTHLERYRNALDDLAHSLKTPLAVIQGTVEQGRIDNPAQKEELREHIDRMKQIVDYHLQRAATSGRLTLKTSVPVENTARRLVDSLSKVYAAKKLDCRVDVDPGCTFDGEQGDLMELLGNLLDNAFKWASSRVAISVQSKPPSAVEPAALVLIVEDDGPGIAPDAVDRLLKRGAKGSDEMPGQGIGLAVVQDIVGVYGGMLQFDRSAMGGAKVQVKLPQRQ